jgi:glycine/D-amino acid oxidase-like deaminating enzyme
MRTRYGVSPWIHQFPEGRRPTFPSIRGDIQTDVVVVGGGLSGCVAAHACAAAGFKTILLEAERVGSGQSGRSAGLLLPEPGPSFRDVATAHGVRAARHAFEAWRRGALDAAATLRRLGITCGLESQDALTAAWFDDTPRLLREHDAREAAGFDVTWLTRKSLQKLGLFDVSGAIKLRESFAIDPYRAVIGLARAATKRRARLFERSAVHKVTFTRKDALVTTADARIRTKKVIVTTGSATPEYRQLRRHLKRRETYLALTEPMTAAMRKAVGPRTASIADTHRPSHRIRWMRDDRILIGGGDQEELPVPKRAAALVQRTGQLMYELSLMYPAISGLQPAYGWQLSYGETADGLMYIGPHRNYPHHLFALGRSGDSITGAFVAARILLRALERAPDKGDDVFSWLR